MPGYGIPENNFMNRFRPPQQPAQPQQPAMPATLPANFPKAPTGPNYGDIQNILNRDPGASTNAMFQQGITAAQPSTGVSPQYQQILDTIRQQQDYATQVGAANAQSLAAKRGISGSSIEQFGTNQAVEAASRAAQDASSNTLLQNASQQNALQQLQAQLYGTRANTLSTLGVNQNQTLAGLTSDEIASQRNQQNFEQQLALQKSLGERGLDISQQNIAASRDIANQQSRNQLLGSVTGAALPFVLGGAMGAGGVGNLFGAGAGAAGAAGGFAPYAAGGLPGPYAAGATGSGAAGAGGIGIGGALAIGGAGVGSMILANSAGNAVGSRTGSNTLGSAASTLANPIGAQLNKVKSIFQGGNIASNIGSAVKSAFGGAGKTADGNAIADTSRGLYSQLDILKQAKQAVANGEITPEQYQQYAQPLIDQSAQAVGSMASKGGTYANAVNKIWKEFQDGGFVTASNGQWLAAA